MTERRPANRVSGREWDLAVDQVLAEVKTFVRGLGERRAFVRSVGVSASDGGGHVVRVKLRADASALAEEIRQRWPGAVQIWVGYWTYPDGDPAPRPSGRPLEPVPALPGVTARLELDGGGQVVSGADLRGRLVIESDLDGEVAFRSAPILRASIVEPGGWDVVGVSTIAIVALAVRRVVSARGSVEAPVVAGTTACQPARSPGLPAGVYEAFAGMRLDVIAGATPQTPGVSARAALVVTDT